MEYSIPMPRKGAMAKVFKGRKVPIGTEGICIWIGNGEWGARVGIKDAAGDVYWTAADNVTEIFGPTPKSLTYERKVYPPAPTFEKGDTVEMTKGEWTGETGEVFWAGTSKAGNPRIGVRFGKGRKASSDFFPTYFAKAA